MNTTKNKLAIFDMDGTLFDTKNVNYRAYSHALRECNIFVDIDYEFYCDFCNGNNYRVFLPIIAHGISEEDIERVHDKKKKLYSAYLNFARKNEHLFSLIDIIKSEYLIALVTTASKKNVKDILETFGVIKVFDFLLTQEDVKKTKPNPEGFILAMQIAGVSKENTLIFEDSDTGIEAADKSGANYVRVYGYN